MGPEIFVPLGFFAFIYGLVYLNNRKKERMALLQFGKDASVFEKAKPDLVSLKWGFILIAIALGILFGDYLVAHTNMEEEVAYFSMVFIFGGISLIISYFVGLKQIRDNKDKNEELPKED